MADEIIIETTSAEVIEVGVPGPQGPAGGGGGSVTYGTTAGTACEGNDSRISGLGSGVLNSTGGPYLAISGPTGISIPDFGLVLEAEERKILINGSELIFPADTVGTFALEDNARFIDGVGANVRAKSGANAGAFTGGTSGIVDVRGGDALSLHGNGGSGGSINLRGGDAASDQGQSGEPGGSIDLSGSSDGAGGSINLSSSGGGNGGSIIMYAGGGSISTNSGGGSIDTSNGGGSINTRGTGSIGLGVSGTRTTLTGTATADRSISLPNASGRIQIEGQPIGNTTPAAIAGTTGTFSTLTANNGTLTASAPVLDLAQTWNNAAVAFTGMRLNVTNTAASNGSSYFIDCQVGGATRFWVRQDGAVQTTGPRFTCFNASIGFEVSASTGSSPCRFATSPADSASIGLRASGNTVDQIGVTATAAQTFRIYNTYTDATNHERLRLAWASNVAIIGTEKGSAGGTARALEFQTDGVTRLTLATTGAATFSSSVVAGGGGFFTSSSLTLSSNFAMSSQVLTATLDCTSNPAGIRLYGLGNTGGSATNTERLHISTRSGASYFISTQATGTGAARALEMRTADVARLTFEAAGGLTIADANDIAVGTTTGTKIGTGTTQKIGFFNATPVVQQAAVADATDAASTQARLNDLLARLRTLGLIAT